MSTRYQFTCTRCNRSVPIETSQAGQAFPCECGETLRVPTMLKIKRLPLWDADESDAPRVDEPTADAPSTPSEPSPAPTVAAPRSPSDLSGKHWGLFAVAALVTVVGAFFLCANLRTPDPRAVFYKRVVYASDGKTVRRDSSPIDALDYSFYFLHDAVNDRVYLVDDYLIDNMSFFHTYHYLDSVRKPEMSDNFYENYEAINSRRVIFLVMSCVATFVGLALALFALFAPKKRRNVGAARGDAWH